MEAVAAQRPADACFGTVVSEAPLEISVEQKLVLGKNQLILPRSLTDHELELEMTAQTAAAGEPSHSHSLPEKLAVRLLCGLRAGERVMLLRLPGGQKYFVLDRVVM